MNIRKRKSRFRIVKHISLLPMSKAEFEQAEEILARLVARAYASDHPEEFEILENPPDSEEVEQEDKQDH